jgi:hypothetical protein
MWKIVGWSNPERWSSMIVGGITGECVVVVFVLSKKTPPSPSRFTL